MNDKTFNEPRIALSRIYTRAGDGGDTRLVGGQRVPKDDARIDCFGVVDELNAFLGLARTTVEELAPQVPALAPFAATLQRVQHELFNLGSILATLPEDVHPKQPRITAAEAQRLEREIDQANESLASLRSFVLPGGSRLDAELHVCRTICRRAERLLVSLDAALTKLQLSRLEPDRVLSQRLGVDAKRELTTFRRELVAVERERLITRNQFLNLDNKVPPIESML